MKSKECEICGKEIKGWNEKMLKWNMDSHLLKHKRNDLSAENPGKPLTFLHTSEESEEISKGATTNTSNNDNNSPEPLKSSEKAKEKVR